MHAWVMVNWPLRRRKIMEGEDDDKFCLLEFGWPDRALPLCVGW